jgi:small subunit ribosomal protein S4
MQVSKGDVIEVKNKSKSSEKFKAIAENHKTTVPQWLEVDVEKMTGRVVGEPVREDIELPIEEHLIVEWYSK